MSASSNTTSIHAIEKLDGTNFYAWKFKIRMVLIDKELWSVVDGTEQKPNENADKWQKKDDKALATICLTIKDTELVHV